MTLTSKDIDRMIAVFPTKEGVRIIVQEELVEVTKSVKDLVTGIDKLVTAFGKLNLEYTAMSEQLSRHERWIREIAQKSNVALSE